MQSAQERQIASRFSAQKQPAPHQKAGRTPIRFLTERLSDSFETVPTAEEFRAAAKTKGDLTIRQALVERLLQIAFTDKVVVIGYDREAREPIERVSSAECLKAIQMLQHYDLGKAPESLSPLQMAEHIRQVERDRIAAVTAVLGAKMREMSPVELAQFFNQCANDPAKFLLQAAQVMSELTGETTPSGPQPEQAALPAEKPEGTP